MNSDFTVPPERVTLKNDAPVNPNGDFVLYWMIASRRVRWNFALQHAIEWGTKLKKPVVVFEPLRLGYKWVSSRLHRFIVEGMLDNDRGLRDSGIRYYPYIEPEIDAGKGLLAEFSQRAAVVVTDEFPCFMLPRMVAAAARLVTVRMETVDGNGLLPLRATNERVFGTAYAFRRFLQKTLPEHLNQFPLANPVQRLKLPPPPSIATTITRRWPPAPLDRGSETLVAGLRFEKAVLPAAAKGGSSEAARILKRFVSSRLDRYLDGRTDLDSPATSGLSPYLHFGHISAHEVFNAVAKTSKWTVDRLTQKANGRRSGWWGMNAPAEAFLDQLVTWRELGYNMTFHRPDYDRFESLPPWAQQTLTDHAKDKRPYLYSLAKFESGATHDPLWNAAQSQLRADGTIHNYLRMLWGKKILEWSPTPQDALTTMVELNNRYALDGRNPNSYSGIFWVLGRYDRPWGPERQIYGKVRYMSSDNTARKMRVGRYIEKYSPAKHENLK